MKHDRPGQESQSLPPEITHLAREAVFKISESGQFKDETAIKDALLAAPLFGYREYIPGNKSFDLIKSESFDFPVRLADGSRVVVEVFFKVDRNLGSAFLDSIKLTRPD